jgi:formylmethanofuran dehydrogenase subunit E-like metal-binding protein
MVTTQITRRKNADTSETLIKHIDGTTLPYSGANLTTMLSGVTNPIFALQRIGANNNSYPFTLQARNQTEFTTASFDTVWNLLLSNPDQPFGKL